MDHLLMPVGVRVDVAGHFARRHGIQGGGEAACLALATSTKAVVAPPEHNTVGSADSSGLNSEP